MKTKVGEQKRPMKQGDEGWDDYKADLEVWEEERDELQDAVSKVLALRSYEVEEGVTLLDADPTILTFPDYMMALIKKGVMEPLPENEWLLKEMWLETYVLGSHDSIEVGWIVSELGGTPKEMVEQMKDNFRNRFLGNVAESMAEQIEEPGQA
jgi:hypothetical protein